MRRNRISVLTLPLLSLLLLLVVPSCLFGQSTALLTGTVLDPSGAVVPQAKVTCSNMETGLTHSMETDAHGLFRFPALPVGTYAVTAAHAGFTPQRQSGVLLVTGHSVDLTIRLKLGKASQTVEVHAPTQEIQLTSSELQSSIQSKSMRDLPLNGRNPLQLTYLTPGTISTQNQNEGEVGWQGANLQLAVDGNRGTDNNFELDGVSFTDLNGGTAPILPNPDALEEFTVKSSNFGASQVGAGATVQFTTRSGTNQFHGEAFEFLRNDVLDARNYFGRGPRIPFKRNQFGGTFGGPIVHNRTFFFGSYQGTRQVGGANPSVAAPPTAAERTGDFTGFHTIYDPLTGQPFPDNQIPGTRFDPVAVKLLKYMPLPNQPGGKFTATPRTNQDDDQALARIDDNLTSRDHLFGRYFYDRFSFESSSAYRDFYTKVEFRNQSFVISDTHTFTPNFLMVAAFAYSRFPRARQPVTPTTMQALGANVPPTQSGLPVPMNVRLGSYGNFSASGYLPIRPQTWEYRTDFTWSHGKHMLQFGLDVLRKEEWGFNGSLVGGEWYYNGQRTAEPSVKGTGDAFADFLLGLPSRFRQSAMSPNDSVATEWMPWVEDNWKILPTVTLNLGLQWAPWFPATNRSARSEGFAEGRQSVLAPNAPKGIIFAGDPGVPGSIFGNDWNNIAPRIGFAWNVDGSGNTVVRSAYGIFFRPLPYNLQRFQEGAGDQSLTFDLSNPFSTADPYGNIPGGSPFPWTPPTAEDLKDYIFPVPYSASAFGLNTHSSYVQEWNLAVQRQLFRNTGITLAYVGNHMVKGVGAREGNPAVYGPGATLKNIDERRPFYPIGSLTLVDSWQYSNYNGLQFIVKTHEQNGLTMLGNYVYSKCMDNDSDTAGDTMGIHQHDLNLDYARCDFDTTQAGNVSLVYDLPRIATLHGFANELVNNWHASTILSLQTGFPYSVWAGLDNSLLGPTNNDVADKIGPSARPSGANPVDEYFNTAAYVPNVIGTVGNSGRNSLTSPSSVTWDLGILKNFPITERFHTQFRFEAFNLLNHPNFDTPDNTLTDHTFGELTTAESPRVLQFAMKLMF